MSDVTAVALSMGERTAARARASIERQTRPPCAVVTVEGVSPYHEAFNQAVSQVSSEFIVGVDADMVLDANCFRDLRSCATDRIALVVGHLRDPLLGRIQGVKLIRTETIHEQGYPDSISSDVDFANTLPGRGWSVVYALNAVHPTPHTFGEHRPDYSPRYTFGRFYVQGARHRYRGALASLQELTYRLAHSEHPSASIAVLAAAHGAFRQQRHDERQPYVDNPEFRALQPFLEGATIPGVASRPPPSESADLETIYRGFLRYGRTLRSKSVFQVFEEQMLRLARNLAPEAWIALLGLCHGLFTSEEHEHRAVEEFESLTALLPAPFRTTRARAPRR